MHHDPLNSRVSMWDAVLDQLDVIERHLAVSLWIGDQFENRKRIFTSLCVRADQPAFVRDVVSDDVGMPADLFDAAILALYEEAFEAAGRPEQIRLCSVNFEAALGSARVLERVMGLMQQDEQVIVEVPR